MCNKVKSDSIGAGWIMIDKAYKMLPFSFIFEIISLISNHHTVVVAVVPPSMTHFF